MAEKINNFFSSSNMEEIIKSQAEKKIKYLETLKDLPYESEIISLVELKQLQSVNLLLAIATERCEKEIKSLELMMGEGGQKNPENFERAKSDIEQKVVSDIMAALDKLDVWAYKFSTESQGTGEDITETPDDSVYYMTSFGASLRLKMANRDKGIRKVIQPVMEKVFFEKIGEELSETPKIGYFVHEYATQDFFDKLAANSIEGDYRSSIKKYKRGNEIEIPKLENIKYSHGGSPVNKIYFEK